MKVVILNFSFFIINFSLNNGWRRYRLMQLVRWRRSGLFRGRFLLVKEKENDELRFTIDEVRTEKTTNVDYCCRGLLQ